MTMRTFQEMQSEFYRAARQELLNGLMQCTEGQRQLFNAMYDGGDHELSTEQVVQAMPIEKLSWAMRQVKTTLDKMPS